MILTFSVDAPPPTRFCVHAADPGVDYRLELPNLSYGAIEDSRERNEKVRRARRGWSGPWERLLCLHGAFFGILSGLFDSISHHVRTLRRTRGGAGRGGAD